MSTLQDRVTERMEVMGLTNAQLAKASGVRPPTSFNWANGKTKNIKGEPLLKAARALGVTPQWLATGKGAKFPSTGENMTMPEYDANTQEAIRLMLTLQEYQSEGAVAALRTHIQNLGPPSHGKDLPMAA